MLMHQFGIDTEEFLPVQYFTIQRASGLAPLVACWLDEPGCILRKNKHSGIS